VHYLESLKQLETVLEASDTAVVRNSVDETVHNFTAVDPADFNTVESVLQSVGGRLQLEDEVVGAGCVMRMKRQRRTGATCVVMHVVTSTEHTHTQCTSFISRYSRATLIYELKL